MFQCYSQELVSFAVVYLSIPYLHALFIINSEVIDVPTCSMLRRRDNTWTNGGKRVRTAEGYLN
jgi:hypothetical protein